MKAKEIVRRHYGRIVDLAIVVALASVFLIDRGGATALWSILLIASGVVAAIAYLSKRADDRKHGTASTDREVESDCNAVQRVSAEASGLSAVWVIDSEVNALWSVISRSPVESVVFGEEPEPAKAAQRVVQIVERLSEQGPNAVAYRFYVDSSGRLEIVPEKGRDKTRVRRHQLAGSHLTPDSNPSELVH